MPKKEKVAKPTEGLFPSEFYRVRPGTDAELLGEGAPLSREEFDLIEFDNQDSLHVGKNFGKLFPPLGAEQETDNKIDLAEVWTWLKKFDRRHARAFVMAAALSFTDWPSRKGLHPPLNKEDIGPNSVWYAAVYRSRELSRKTSYLAEFFGRLIEFGFPIEKRGTNTAARKIARVILGEVPIKDAEVTEARARAEDCSSRIKKWRAQDELDSFQREERRKQRANPRRE